MKTIFQILQEKEEQLRALQAQIEKLRAAAEIVAQEQGSPMQAAVAAQLPARNAPVVMPAPTHGAKSSEVAAEGHKPVWP